MKLPGLLLLLCGCFRNISRLSVQVAEGRPLRTPSVFAAVHTDAVLRCGAVTEPVGLSSVVLLEWLRLNGPEKILNGPEKILYVVVDGQKMRDQAEEYRDRTSLQEDGSLMLQDVQTNDTGDYKCVFQTRTSLKRVEAKVTLAVVELSEPAWTVHRSRTNQLELECDCSSQGLQPKVSVLDARGTVLTNQTGTRTGPYDLSVRVGVAAVEGSQTGSVMLICRAEVSEVHLMKENRIQITDHFRLAGPEGSPGFLVGLMVFNVLVVLFVISLVFKNSRRILRKLQRLWTEFCRRIVAAGGDQPEGDEYDTEFRDLDELTTTGASEMTTNANNLRVSGVDASCRLANDDLHQMSTYKDDIIDVGRALHFHPALIAAIISKQSRAGTALKESGFGLYPDCFGLMQISKRYHVGKGEPFSRDHIDEGTTYLIHLIKTMKNREETWTPEQHLKGALVGYMIGIEGVPQGRPDDLDSLTPTKDFANDVIARAKVFAGEGYV